VPAARRRATTTLRVRSAVSSARGKERRRVQRAHVGGIGELPLKRDEAVDDPNRGLVGAIQENWRARVGAV